jgi:hypothetical protein
MTAVLKPSANPTAKRASIWLRCAAEMIRSQQPHPEIAQPIQITNIPMKKMTHQAA